MRATEDMNRYHALKREQAFNRMFRRCQIVNAIGKMPKSGPAPCTWTLAARLRETMNNPHHVNPMSERFKALLVEIHDELVRQSGYYSTPSLSNGGA